MTTSVEYMLLNLTTSHFASLFLFKSGMYMLEKREASSNTKLKRNTRDQSVGPQILDYGDPNKLRSGSR